MAKKRIYRPTGPDSWERKLVDPAEKTPKGWYDSQADCEAAMRTPKAPAAAKDPAKDVDTDPAKGGDRSPGAPA